ncbi:MAG: DUF2064 domain-containing protein, partial [Planctomycetota bacterium]
LAAGEVVLGPSDDGGFYALGLPNPFPNWCDVFQPTEWGTGVVLSRTRAVIEAWGHGFLEMAPFRDFDHEEDLVQWARAIEANPEPPSDSAKPRRTFELALQWELLTSPGALSRRRDAGEAGSSRESS